MLALVGYGWWKIGGENNFWELKTGEKQRSSEYWAGGLLPAGLFFVSLLFWRRVYLVGEGVASGLAPGRGSAGRYG